MRIIHCADVHLDSALNMFDSKDMDEADKKKKRKIELLNTFLRMIEYAKTNGVEAIIIAGDLFDTKKISATSKNAVYKAILENSGITFFYIKGNHDQELFCEGLQIPENLKLFSESFKKYTLGEVDIYGIELSSENKLTFYDELYMDSDRINIVTMHGQESASLSKDKAETIDIKRLKNKGIDYLALGHIHKMKTEKLDGRGVYVYPGCLEGRGFDECGEHGFMLLNIDEKSKKIDTEFVSFAARHLYEERVDISGLNSTLEVSERIKKILAQKDYLNDDCIKVTLLGTVDYESDIDDIFLQSQFKNRFYFFKIKKETVYHVDYNAYIGDESLKGEFVRTVMEAKDLSDDEKGAVIRYGIKALRNEELRG